uniref:Uncharacterized protein n=1 Tax=Cacopsylla melanoneura TaxID=428564 RepID=A0A8D8PYE9_9HEMI
MFSIVSSSIYFEASSDSLLFFLLLLVFSKTVLLVSVSKISSIISFRTFIVGLCLGSSVVLTVPSSDSTMSPSFSLDASVSLFLLELSTPSFSSVTSISKVPVTSSFCESSSFLDASLESLEFTSTAS